MKAKKRIAYGWHAASAIIQKNHKKVKFVYFQQDRDDLERNRLTLFLKQHHIPFQFVSKKELDHLSQKGVHQGIVILCEPENSYDEKDLPRLLSEIKKTPLLLLLDCIEDPHNLGACLRSANAAGVDLVIAPKDRSAGITPVTYKAASGALDTIPFIQVTNLSHTIKFLKENQIWVIGATSEAHLSLYDVDLSMPLAFVLGGEGKGLRRLTKSHCDLLVNIPMKGSVPSLNVSVSAGICLFEAIRQRRN